jgi:hypothetical protein
MAISIIRNYIAKQLFKKGGAIANSKAVDFSTNAIIKRLNNYNIKPTDITSEDQLLRVLNSVKQAEDNLFNNRFRSIMENNKFFKKQADVIDMTGKKINPKSKIMGGRQVETEAEIAERIKKENKESIQRLKEKKTDEPEDFASGGRAGFQIGGSPAIDPRMQQTYQQNVEANRQQQIANQIARFGTKTLQPTTLTGPTTRLYHGTTQANPFGGSKFFATPDKAKAAQYATTGALRGSPFAGAQTGRILQADVPTSQAQSLLKKGLTGTREAVLDPQAAKTLFETGKGTLKGASSLGTKAALAGTKALPVIGGAASLADAASRLKQGDYVGAGLGAAGAVPVLGLPALGAQVVYDAAKNNPTIQKVGTSIGEGVYNLLNPEAAAATPTKDFSGFENSIITDGDSKYRINADGSRTLIGKIGETTPTDSMMQQPGETFDDFLARGGNPYSAGRPSQYPASRYTEINGTYYDKTDPQDAAEIAKKISFGEVPNLVDRPTMADVAGPAQEGLIPGFTAKERSDGRLEYTAPDGQVYGPDTYADIAAGMYPNIYKHEGESKLITSADYPEDYKGAMLMNQGGRVGLNKGGLAPLLGEPTYEDDDYRVPYKDGRGPKMSRRNFIKIMGGLAALPVVGKLFKFAKPAAKAAKVADVTSVPIGNAAGMPAWFKPLVNRVIKEGTEVNSGAERIITHKTKLPNSKTDVYVNQDLNNGDVWVDLGVEKHGFADGKFGQPVRLEYKAAEEIPLKRKKGSVKTKEEFNVEEAEFTGGHPENVKFEEVSVNKFGKHESDFSEVEAFAKGKTKKGARNVSESFDKMNEDLADHFSNYPRPDDYASGGRVPLGGGGIALKILAILKNPKKIKAAVDDIFPTGDYKYDAQMAAEALVENNPKVFGGKLMDDLDDATRSEVYGAVIGPIQQNALMISRMKQATKPTKTLKGIHKTGTINISDPDVAEEFARFMKETDPKGHKKIEQTVDLMNLDPKGKKGHATGGRVPRFKGGIMKLLKTILKKTPKKSYERVDLEKLLRGKDKIPVYSGSMKRSSNTWKSFVEDAKQLGTTPEKIAKDKFKGQWFTPFRSYAESFMDPKDLTSKMRTVELTPKEIAIAKRYVKKVNKKALLASKRRKLNIKPFPKQNITTSENLVLIPRYKLKKLKKENRIMTDYLIKDKIKSKLGLAEGGVAGMLGE